MAAAKAAWERRMAPGAPLLAPLLLLILEVPLWPGLPAEPQETPADGRSLSSRSLEETETSRAFTCLAAAPSLTWYLNGELQQPAGNDTSFGRLIAVADGDVLPEGGGSSTFVVSAARRLDRELNCSSTDPNTGRVSSASVTLHVQFKPEMVRLDAHYEEARDPGFLLVLLVLVQANPPANITWVDQDGQVMVNTSRFLIVDTKTYPWLTNHTVHVQLSSLAHNASFRAWEEDRGTSNSSSFPLPGFLDTRIELPLLALVLGCVVALGTLLALGSLISCAIYRQGQKAAGLPPAALPPLPSSDTNNLRPKAAHLPRANMSVPCNLQLNDLTTTPTVKVQVAGSVEEQEEEEPVSHTSPAEPGPGRFPMIGYIYRAPSMSSDEIWL